jgi:transcriptional regulator with XRE-family HTH domain
MTTRIGEIIARRRAEHGLTQRQLAHLVGTTVSAVGQWELGLKMPTVRSRIMLSAALDIPVLDLLYEFEPGADEHVEVVREPELLCLIRLWRNTPPELKPTLFQVLRATVDGFAIAAGLTKPPPEQTELSAAAG